VVPYAYALTLSAVDLDALWTAGFRGIIVDVDNTLIAFDRDEIASEVRAWFDRARTRGFRLVCLSNNFPPRVGQVSTLLGCPGVPNALKPLPFGFLVALRLLEVPRRQAIVIGDQFVTDILGAACVGLPGILVNPIVEKDFPLTRVFRWIERRVIDAHRPRA
jgi:HAD superfamily phosphatase (TIGR01668 family)